VNDIIIIGLLVLILISMHVICRVISNMSDSVNYIKAVIKFDRVEKLKKNQPPAGEIG
jgi:hypothetical protein